MGVSAIGAVSVGGRLIAIKAALGLVSWLDWFSNNVPYGLSGKVLLELRCLNVPLERAVLLGSRRSNVPLEELCCPAVPLKSRCPPPEFEIWQVPHEPPPYTAVRFVRY